MAGNWLRHRRSLPAQVPGVVRKPQVERRGSRTPSCRVSVGKRQRRRERARLGRPPLPPLVSAPSLSHARARTGTHVQTCARAHGHVHADIRTHVRARAPLPQALSSRNASLAASPGPGPRGLVPVPAAPLPGGVPSARLRSLGSPGEEPPRLHQAEPQPRPLRSGHRTDRPAADARGRGPEAPLGSSPGRAARSGARAPGRWAARSPQTDPAGKAPDGPAGSGSGTGTNLLGSLRQ